MCYSFETGARGFLVWRLQVALGVAADGVYGGVTAAAVALLQRANGFKESGKAGQAEFRAAGLNWPSEYERCMNFVCNLEGTSFGDCNETDIDGAGLTMGIAGFTSAHNEVQLLLHQYLSQNPGAAAALESYPEFQRLYVGRAAASAWKQLFFTKSGKVSTEWRAFIRKIGADPLMQHLQLALAQTRFWKLAISAARDLKFQSVQAKCFFLDVGVQNGGWRASHLLHAKRQLLWLSGREGDRLLAAAHAVAVCAKPRWQRDVLLRKLTIAKGEGVVHGRKWQLKAHAI